MGQGEAAWLGELSSAGAGGGVRWGSVRLGPLSGLALTSGAGVENGRKNVLISVKRAWNLGASCAKRA